MTFSSNLLEIYRCVGNEHPCTYLPDQTAKLEYRVVVQANEEGYEALLSRGWRRFGRYFFRPVCDRCSQCISLRVEVANFRPTKSQRKTLRRNAEITLRVQSPTVSADHIRLYNAYHQDMTERRGWKENVKDQEEYAQTFLEGNWSFSREFLYYRGDELIGVGLVDEIESALSSVYFFHDPSWRSDGPGTFTMLKEIEYAAENNLDYLYLGYWVPGCQSMSYKSKLHPHQLLEEYVEDHDSPTWNPPT